MLYLQFFLHYVISTHYLGTPLHYQPTINYNITISNSFLFPTHPLQFLLFPIHAKIIHPKHKVTNYYTPQIIITTYYKDPLNSLFLLSRHFNLMNSLDFSCLVYFTMQKRNAKKVESEKKYYAEKKYICGD